MRRFLIPPGSVLIIPTAAQARDLAGPSSPAAGHDATWGRAEVIALARQMVHQLRDGLSRAARYLRQLGFELQEALQVLFPARVAK